MFTTFSTFMAITAVFAILAALSWHFVRPGRSHLLLSPLLALGVTALLFYAVIPVAVLPVLDRITEFDFYKTRAHAFDGSFAQLLIWAFGLVCLGLHILFAHLSPAPSVFASPTLFIPTSLGVTALALFTLWAGWNARHSHPFLSSDAVAWLGSALVFGCSLIIVSAQSRHRLIVAALIALVALGALYLVGSGKRVAFSTLALTLAFVAVGRIQPRALVVLVTLGIVLASFGATRSLHRHESNPLSELGLLFEHKVWGRQVETGLCLDQVIAKRWNDDFGRSPFYFASGLIPRTLWQAKPNFSLGNQHALEYCDPAASPQHSASITLLGEPLENAGPTGLVMMMLVISGIGGVIIRFGLNRTSLPLALSAALYPWLMDFDQDFAMYLANAVKFTLPLWPLAFALAYYQHKREQRPQRPGPEPLP